MARCTGPAETALASASGTSMLRVPLLATAVRLLVLTRALETLLPWSMFALMPITPVFCMMDVRVIASRARLDTALVKGLWPADFGLA